MARYRALKEIAQHIFLLLSVGRDVRLFLISARSDARLEALRSEVKAPCTAFDQLYAEAPQNDPWVSGSSKYQYQRRKYDAMMSLLQGKTFRHALDLGCGIGLFTERLASCADHVLGMDISSVAISCAKRRNMALDNVSFQRGDIVSLGQELNARFDLIVVADTLYYLPHPIDDKTLKEIASRLGQLLLPGGLLLVVNHFFPIPTADSRLTRRIHNAFHWSPALMLLEEQRRPFFLSSLMTRPGAVHATIDKNLD
ncbi:methyltransferase domain-containing protein (plasmid) [Cupriavidus sp. P-10]|uniref:class I SAM-dependent DNA methyltransferase n=1 Tax=unclassified Cupriavidus TaxID=2640874 RepID=UPI000E2FDBBE|nr:class I SAM-dependent methyltransferase [Cupriavidus sp. P-10]BDB30569.1 methyltransferase domain-containing protein [Cupriavidus sp. P-10]